MDQIKAIGQAISAKRDEIAGIKSELDRCATCIAAVAETKETLATLKKQRKHALTDAFMAGKEADNSEVDKLIKAAEKAAASAADTAAGAEGAKEVLQERLEAAEEEVERLLDQQSKAAYAVCEQEFQAAETAYTEAAEALHAAVAKMMASNSVSARFKRGQYGFSSLREIMKGFYTDGLNINRGRHLPESFGLRFLTLAEEKAAPEAKRLLVKLEEAGFEMGGDHHD